MGVDQIIQCSRMKGWRMERMLRVHRVKFAEPGFNSMSPERRKKARRSGLRKRSARWRAKNRKTRLGRNAVGVLLASDEVQGRMDLARR